MQKVLLQKRPGEWWLAVWRPVSVWDYLKYAPIPRTASPLQLTFAAPQKVEVHKDLSLTADPTTPSTPVTSLKLNVGPDVTLVKITG